jgi:hypothetical protein
VRFTQWLLDLEDEDGVLHQFHKVIYSDINNGCASSKFDALGWKKHFYEKHADSADRLTELLSLAYAYYAMKADEK